MKYTNQILQGNSLEVLKQLSDESINCCITSPPYWGLRDYGVEGQLGLEKTPEEYVQKLVDIFKEVKRVLKSDGTLWLNLGDSYAGNKVGNTEIYKNKRAVTGSFKKTIPENLKSKDLIGIPWKVAFALQADGWYLRQDIIWNKPNPMPESVKDRCTKAHEYIFLLSKSPKYYYDYESIKEKATNSGKEISLGEKSFSKGQAKGANIQPSGNGNADTYLVPEYRNKRSVWTVTPKPFKEAHFATFPPDLIEPCVLAGCPQNGIILDPFIGSGTTGLVAKKLNRNYIGVELNPEYIKIAERRIFAS